VIAAVCVLAAYSVIAHLAIGAVKARMYWRGDRLDDLVAAQLAVGDAIGAPLADRVRFAAVLPERGGADELAVIGDCDAVYIGTGESLSSWIAVDHRDRTFRLDVESDGMRPGSTSLMWFGSHTLRQLLVKVNLDGRARLVMIGATPDRSGHWLAVEPGDTIGVTVRDDSEVNRFVATATVAGSDQRSVVTAPMTEWNHQFRSVPIIPHLALNGEADAARIGLRLSVGTDAPPALCDRLR
jgi:hypothetical protein